MSYQIYQDIYSLAEFSFIAGTEYILEYTVYEDNGVVPLDISSGTTKLFVCQYGQPEYVVIEKAGVLSITTGVFTVTLSTDDTKEWSGKYIQQPTVYDFAGTEYRLGQGVFTVLPRIANA